MIKGLAIGIEHFPDFTPYPYPTRRIGVLLFAGGINVLIQSDLEQSMTDAEYDMYCCESRPIPRRDRTALRTPFQALVFG